MVTGSSRKRHASFSRWIRPLRRWWKPLQWIWITIIVGVSINVGSSWLLAKSVDISGTPLGWVVDHLGITLLLVGVLILFTCLAGLAHYQVDAPVGQVGQLVTITPQQRLQCVRSFRQEYSSRLTHSMQGRVDIELRLHERTDVIASSAGLVFHHTDTSTEYPLAPGISIIRIYDQAHRGLLILGAPGSGKTTLVLHLALELLERVESNPDHPIPIILNLSSWSDKKLDLADWFCEQLYLVYGIPKRVSVSWIEYERVIFLLDGLDEIEDFVRSACIEAINAYRREHFIPLVICSRSREYENQQERLNLPAAVEIQPLELAQVKAYLKQAGKSLAAVRAVMRNNTTLQQLLTTPLMLSIIIMAYQDKTVKELPYMGSLDEQQKQIFEHYVQRMLERHQSRRTITSLQLSRSLHWLAQQMQQRHLTEFYLESLQSTWIAAKLLQIIYQLLVGLVAGVIVTLVFALFFALLFGQNLGLIIGLVCGLLSGLSHSLGDIAPTEAFVWSWKKAREKLIWYFIGVSVSVPVVAFLDVQDVQKSDLISVLIFTLIFFLLIVLIFVLRDGLLEVSINVNMRYEPNQGIHNSGRNALRIGIITTLMTGVFYVTICLLAVSLGSGEYSGAASRLTVFLPFLLGLIMLFFGLYNALILGGYEYLKHYLLRVFLWRSGVLPWLAVSLLEEAAACILLQRVGGGYRFIHPLLQEHFASLATSPTSP